MCSVRVLVDAFDLVTRAWRCNMENQLQFRLMHSKENKCQYCYHRFSTLLSVRWHIPARTSPYQLAGGTSNEHTVLLFLLSYCCQSWTDLSEIACLGRLELAKLPKRVGLEITIETGRLERHSDRNAPPLSSALEK